MTTISRDLPQVLKIRELEAENAKLRAQLATAELAAVVLRDELASRPTQWAYDQACNARNTRAERAEAACAQMREALIGVMAQGVPTLDLAEQIMDAIAADAGKGWVSTEGAVESEISATKTGAALFSVVGPVPADWIGHSVWVIRKPEGE